MSLPLWYTDLTDSYDRLKFFVIKSVDILKNHKNQCSISKPLLLPALPPLLIANLHHLLLSLHQLLPETLYK